jgi:hypothetical protein
VAETGLTDSSYVLLGDQPYSEEGDPFEFASVARELKRLNQRSRVRRVDDRLDTVAELALKLALGRRFPSPTAKRDRS